MREVIVHVQFLRGFRGRIFLHSFEFPLFCGMIWVGEALLIFSFYRPLVNIIYN